MTDSDLIAEARARFRRAWDHQARWRAEAREDFAFVAGDQWGADDRRHLDEQDRPPVTFNRIAPMVAAVAGWEVNNRQEVRFVPREAGDARVNELLTGAAQWIRDQCDAEDEESDAFADALVCGMGWTETRVDYEHDPDGTIAIERVDPLEMAWDPAATKRCLSDAAWLFRLRDMDVDQAATLFGGRVRTAPTESGGGWGEMIDGSGPEGTPHLRSEGDAYGAGAAEPRMDPGPRHRVRIVEYQYRRREPVYRVPDPASGALVSLPPERFARLRRLLEAQGRTLEEGRTHLRQHRQRVFRAVLAGDLVLRHGPAPAEAHFSYRCITGQRDRNRNQWHGIVRPMKDPQRWANKFFSQILHIVNANAKGGVMVETGAVEDERRFEEEWARPDSVAWVSPGGIGRVQPKPQAGYPSAVDRLMQFSISSVRDVTGINVELLGMADRVQPGVLESQRKQSALTILAPVFDSLRRYRKEQGRLLLALIDRYLTDGRLVRILGPEGARFVPLVRQPGVETYDVIVDDAPSSVNEKERTWAVLQTVLPLALKAGAPPPAEVLDYLPLPQSLAEKWKARIAEPSPDDPRAREAIEADRALRRAKAEAEILKTRSEATLNEAEAAEEMSRALRTGKGHPKC